MADYCYRHPDRETRVSCSRCGRPICPDCMYPAPVGMHCPECAGEQTRIHRGPVGSVSGAMTATWVLIAINVIVFIAELGGGGGAGSLEGGGTLIRDGGLYGPAVDSGEWYRIVTSGFLHAGPLHLILNMFVLYILGQLLEPAIGPARFVGIYLVSLLGGSFGALLLDPDTVTVGASGAVYGLMGAAIVVARQRGVSDLASQIGFWLILNLIFTFSVPGISIGGHLGGLAAGALGALVISSIGVATGPRGLRLELGALALIGAVAVAASLVAAGASATGAG